MIKVTFKKPQEIYQYGILSECLFVICKQLKFRSYNVRSVTDTDVMLLNNAYSSQIKSIEHVKPTDL